MTRTFRVTNSVLTLTTLSGSSSSGGVGVGVGFRRGGGGGSPRVGTPWPIGVGFGAGVGVGVAVGRLAGACKLPVLETGAAFLVGVGVGVGFATAFCVLRRGRESGSCDAEAAKQRNAEIDTIAATKTEILDSVELNCLLFIGLL
jgi:hypothetical protein